MSFNYASVVDAAKRLITQFGQTATLTRIIRDAVNETQTGVAVQDKISEADRARIGNVQVPVRKYLIADATPKPGDRLACGTDDLVIMQADPLAPGNTVILWTVIARAG